MSNSVVKYRFGDDDYDDDDNNNNNNNRQPKENLVTNYRN